MAVVTIGLLAGDDGGWAQLLDDTSRSVIVLLLVGDDDDVTSRLFAPVRNGATTLGMVVNRMTAGRFVVVVVVVGGATFVVVVVVVGLHFDVVAGNRRTVVPCRRTKRPC